jgi:hypothetical protein
MWRYIFLIWTEGAEANLLKRSHWHKLLFDWGNILDWFFVIWRSIRLYRLVSFRMSLFKYLILWTLFLHTLLIVDFIYLVFLRRYAMLNRSLFLQLLDRLRVTNLLIIIIRCPIFQKILIIRSATCCRRLWSILSLTVLLRCKRFL